MKRILCALLVVMMLLTLTACGGKSTSEIQRDDDGNALITSDWNLTAITSKMGVTEYKGNAFKKKKPSFHTDDGVNFVFTNNGKEHTGTLVEEDGYYSMNFNDSESPMEIRIKGDFMEIQLPESNSKIIMTFEAQ